MSSESSDLSSSSSSDSTESTDVDAEINRLNAGLAEMRAERQNANELVEDGMDLEQEGEVIDITMAEVRDGVVGTSTMESYVLDLLHFVRWCIETNPLWVTDYGKEQIQLMGERQNGEGVRAMRRCIKMKFKQLLREAENIGVVHVETMVDRGYSAQCASFPKLEINRSEPFG